MSELLTIAQRLDIGPVALIGDKRQLSAVEAGKPWDGIEGTWITTETDEDTLGSRILQRHDPAFWAELTLPASLKLL